MLYNARVMDVSVVVTVLNEERSINSLLDSLLSQTLRPTEIVVVDGGSKDKTVEILRSYKIRTRILRIIRKKGSISRSRNLAVRKARYPIIAQIDGGCIAEKDWLEKITAPFNDDTVGLVAGFYRMVGETPFQKAVAPFHGVTTRCFDHRCFMPSGRSIAFRKVIWKKVGGYSEKLDRAGEDTLFNYNVMKAGINIERVPDAIVYWEVPKTFKEAIKKFFYYAKGDAQTGIWWHPAQRLSTHRIKITLIFVRYIIGLTLLFSGFVDPIFWYLLVILVALYIAWSIYKMRNDIHDFRAQMWVPIIQIASDITVISGFLAGILYKPE
jgi:cellulose synthase/poly-beta-1,6-N-acetylglucosamine synthase-like glycosyltransferase